MRRRCRLAALAILGAMTGSALVVPTGAASAEPGELVEIAARALYLSPNGDHVRDVANVRFTLSESSRVSVRIREIGKDGETQVRLGRLAAGDHRWRWQGLDLDGRPLPDGQFVLDLVAARGAVTDHAYVVAVVRGVPRDTMASSRTTVYPAATVVHDRVELAYLREGWDSLRDEDPDNEAFTDEPDPVQVRVALRITDRKGAVVYRAAKHDYTPRFSWDARRPDGTPHPAGRYLARMRSLDVLGNTVTVQRWITVTSAQLREELWTYSSHAALAEPYAVLHRDTVCSAVPSERFIYGLHFGTCYGGWGEASAALASEVYFPISPLDSYRVTVNGGPAVPGSQAFGALDRDGGSGTGVQMGPGDATATTAWRDVEVLEYPTVLDSSRPVLWSFSTSSYGAGYDLDTVTVEYLHYVPVS